MDARYSRRIVVCLGCSFAVVELIGQFLPFSTCLGGSRRLGIIVLVAFLYFRLLNKSIEKTRVDFNTIYRLMCHGTGRCFCVVGDRG